MVSDVALPARSERRVRRRRVDVPPLDQVVAGSARIASRTENRRHAVGRPQARAQGIETAQRRPRSQLVDCNGGEVASLTGEARASSTACSMRRSAGTFRAPVVRVLRAPGSSCESVCRGRVYREGLHGRASHRGDQRTSRHRERRRRKRHAPASVRIAPVARRADATRLLRPREAGRRRHSFVGRTLGNGYHVTKRLTLSVGELLIDGFFLTE